MSTGMAPTDCAPSTSSGTPVSALIASTGRRWPVIQDTCESATSRVRGPTSASTAASASSAVRPRVAATRTRAPETCSGPSNPKCSSSVVTISSPGSRRSPESTIWQPIVVDAVTATWSGCRAEQLGEEPAHASACLDQAVEVRLAAATPLELERRLRAHGVDRLLRQRPERPGIEVRDVLEDGERRHAEHYFSAVAEVVRLGRAERTSARPASSRASGPRLSSSDTTTLMFRPTFSSRPRAESSGSPRTSARWRS